MFFQHENRFRYKFFRYCSIFKVLCAAALAANDLIILPQKWFFVKHFFEKLLNFFELKSFSSFSVLTGTFERSLVLFKGFLLRLQKSFFCLSAWRSHIVPYRNYFCKPFLHFFRLFLRFVYISQFFARFEMAFWPFFHHFCAKQPPHKTCSGCCLVIQFFSSCFISRRVSQTAAASIGSAAISPMGMGPSTL